MISPPLPIAVQYLSNIYVIEITYMYMCIIKYYTTVLRTSWEISIVLPLMGTKYTSPQSLIFLASCRIIINLMLYLFVADVNNHITRIHEQSNKHIESSINNYPFINQDRLVSLVFNKLVYSRRAASLFYKCDYLIVILCHSIKSH